MINQTGIVDKDTVAYVNHPDPTFCGKILGLQFVYGKAVVDKKTPLSPIYDGFVDFFDFLINEMEWVITVFDGEVKEKRKRGAQLI